MLTNGSLQGVTILKDKILEDNTGVALDKAKIEVLIKSFAFSEKQAKAFVKMNNIMNDKNE